MRYKVLVGAIALALILSTGSCGKSDQKSEGQAEKAIDQATEKAGTAMEKAGEALKETGQQVRVRGSR